MVAVAHHQDHVAVWPEQVCRLAEHQIKIVAAEVLWSDVTLAAAPVLFALHQAKHITKHQRMTTNRLALLKVLQQQLAVALRIV